MLQSLHIRNIALIDEIEAEFSDGLNVITGETGAGKSIMIGALKMILGARASFDAVRTGEKKAVVEAVFDITGNERLLTLLTELDLDPGSRLVVRREVMREHSRAFVNDSPVRLDTLRSITANLIDLHGQHDHQSLLRSETHLPLLDGIGDYGSELATYSSLYERVLALRSERAGLLASKEELERERELAEFQLMEIDAVNPVPDEETGLQNELTVLDNVEKLVQGARTAYLDLYAGEETVYDRLAGVVRLLEDLSDIEEKFGPLKNELGAAGEVISEAAVFLRDYSDSTAFEPERADEIRERLGALDVLKRKYGGTIESVLEHVGALRETRDRAESFDASIAALTAEISVVDPQFHQAARDLSVCRHEAAENLARAVVEELSALAMKRATFEVVFTSEEDAHGFSIETGAFYLSTNPGEPIKPLEKVASGGETSRIMLALKSILAKSDRVGTLVFDEIDTGISGAIAERVGNAFAALASRHQIIAITHLPQIAAFGDTHFAIRKKEIAGRATTEFFSLTEHERVHEVASLLSGAEISSAALESARQLLAASRNRKPSTSTNDST